MEAPTLKSIMTTPKLKETNNIVRLSRQWLDALIGQTVVTPDGQNWTIGYYEDEQLWFVPVDDNHRISLGRAYTGGLSLSN